MCVVSVIIKRPMLPPYAVDGRSRNPLYYDMELGNVCKCTPRFTGDVGMGKETTLDSSGFSTEGSSISAPMVSHNKRRVWMKLRQTDRQTETKTGQTNRQAGMIISVNSHWPVTPQNEACLSL